MMAIDVDEERNRSFLPDKVWDSYKSDALLECADKRLGLEFNVQDMEHLLLVGLSCTQKSSHLRPSIRQVAHALSSIEPLLHLLVNEESSWSNSSATSGILNLDMTHNHTNTIANEECESSSNHFNASEGTKSAIIHGVSPIASSDSFVKPDILPKSEVEIENIAPCDNGMISVESNSVSPKVFDLTNDAPTEVKQEASSTSTADDPMVYGLPSDDQDEKNKMFSDSYTIDVNTEEIFDIGIPPHYSFHGPVKEFQLQILKGYAAGLRENCMEGAKFNDVMERIKALTATLIMLKAPLDEWNSHAQNVLQGLKKIETINKRSNQEVYPNCRDLTSVKLEMERQAAEIDEDDEEIANFNEFLESAQQEHASLSNKLSSLQSQIAQIQEKIKDVENEINFKQDSINVAKGRKVQRLKVFDCTKAEYSILSIYDSMLSRLPPLLAADL